ncbi:NUDIX hydrolase [Hirschia baltica]|uniref:NUDIX hydrolase n=1 Tax=Hirschia baltica (strain ATCC 49814 / DSM 5838 / IFAM 1418) TaxID=582402 RepID=C6XL75_HIRBI|nr:NUDIX hydrolase [Hirschia baltica]ACT59674.1 NUDIX hydrolase [Hirschia baltica ATCC 49814]
MPRDAATMILVRSDGPQPRILMGQRASGHDFMPNKYVFPGGRMDPCDLLIPPLDQLNPTCQSLLNQKSKTSPTGLVLSAIRETFEETGLVIGENVAHPVDTSSIEDESWKAYLGHSVRPSLKNIQFIGRAITPPYRAKRFDARFFLARSEVVLAHLKRPADSHELLDLQWFTFEQIADLDLPSITRFTIQEAHKRITTPEIPHAPFFTYWEENKNHLERLSSSQNPCDSH